MDIIDRMGFYPGASKKAVMIDPGAIYDHKVCGIKKTEYMSDNYPMSFLGSREPLFRN